MYPPPGKSTYQKWWKCVGRLLSSWNGPFLGDMLIFTGGTPLVIEYDRKSLPILWDATNSKRSAKVLKRGGSRCILYKLWRLEFQRHLCQRSSTKNTVVEFTCSEFSSRCLVANWTCPYPVTHSRCWLAVKTPRLQTLCPKFCIHSTTILPNTKLVKLPIYANLYTYI